MENKRNNEMRFILSLIMAFTLSIQASAAEEKVSTDTDEQEKCSGKEDAFLRGLEEELANCKIQMDDAPSTADMNEAYYKFGDCSIAVANKLFDQNYKKYNAEVKKNFDALVTAYYACAHDMYEDSDFASIRGGTMYNTMAVTSATFWIRDMVKEYLHQARIECDDKAGFDSLEIE